jgi:hypothetical protein
MTFGWMSAWTREKPWSPVMMKVVRARMPAVLRGGDDGADVGVDALNRVARGRRAGAIGMLRRVGLHQVDQQQVGPGRPQDVGGHRRREPVALDRVAICVLAVAAESRDDGIHEPGRRVRAGARQPGGIRRRLIRFGKEHVHRGADGDGPRRSGRGQPARLRALPDRRHLHGAELVVPARRSDRRIEHRVADDAVAGRPHAGGNRRVRGIGHRGMTDLDAFGRRSRLAQRLQVRQAHAFAGRIEIHRRTEAVDRDDHDVVGGAGGARGRRGRLPLSARPGRAQGGEGDDADESTGDERSGGRTRDHVRQYVPDAASCQRSARSMAPRAATNRRISSSRAEYSAFEARFRSSAARSGMMPQSA